jgi:cytidine deaminase
MGGGATVKNNNDDLVQAARDAARNAYAPYSGFQVGAALRFADGSVVTGTNIENASYGMTVCAETVAVTRAMADGRRGGLEAVAVIGSGDDPVTPCGRCRQVLYELAALGGTDPLMLCAGAGEGVREMRLSALLPEAFGPASLV